MLSVFVKTTFGFWLSAKYVPSWNSIQWLRETPTIKTRTVCCRAWRK